MCWFPEGVIELLPPLDSAAAAAGLVIEAAAAACAAAADPAADTLAITLFINPWTPTLPPNLPLLGEPTITLLSLLESSWPELSALPAEGPLAAPSPPALAMSPVSILELEVPTLA